MIALVDYGAGNPTSVKKAFAAIGAELFVPGSPREIDRATAAVVPGVGHFGATRALAGDWTDAVRRFVESGRPLLGICVGMQWLFETSEEAPDVPGLAIFPGRIRRLTASPPVVKVPHVGWNSLAVTARAPIVEHVADGVQVYFTHSYAPPVVEGTVAVTTHGETFAAVVQRGLVAGVQFHPEKSGDTGLQMLRNFLAMAR
jgi:glutamine amidotransferase